MKLLFKIFVFSFIGILAITSCKKKTVTGPTGATGAQGATGNANVISRTFTITTWTPSGYTYASDYLYLPELDSAVFVSGSVMTYMMNSSSFYPLPLTDGTFMFEAEYGLNYAQLFIFNMDHSPFSSSPSPVIVRIVIIPPAVKKLHPTINYKDYNEVKQALQLND